MTDKSQIPSNTKTDPVALREQMRGTIFSTRKARKEIVQFAGQNIEVRSPSLGAVMDSRDEPNTKRMIARMIVNYCYVPESDVKIFEEADIEAIIAMPFDEDFVRLNKAIQSLTGISVEAEIKN